MLTAFLIGLALPIVLFLIGLATLALARSRQDSSIREARIRLKVR